jgi:hypothetical protein
VAQLWCGVAQLWCGVAQIWCGVAQLMVWSGSFLVRRGSVMVRRGSAWRGVAQFTARRLVEGQARVRFSARHHREVFPTELTSDEDMERGVGEC